MSEKAMPIRWGMDNRQYELYETCLSAETCDCHIHWHTHFLLNIVLEGEGSQIINNEEYLLKTGSVVVLSPFDFHRNSLEPGGRIRYQSLKFSEKLFEDSMMDFISVSDFPLIGNLSEESFGIIKDLLNLLKQEQKRKEYGWEKFSEGLICQIMLLLLRADRKQKYNSIYVTNIRKALLYVNNHFQEEIRVADVAEYVGYTPNHFSAVFTRETGLTFQKYLQEMRLGFAKRLLLTTELPVSEICFESGFNTIPNFTLAFKKKYGMSPRNIRAEAATKTLEAAVPIEAPD